MTRRDAALALVSAVIVIGGLALMLWLISRHVLEFPNP